MRNPASFDFLHLNHLVSAQHATAEEEEGEGYETLRV
jgi:hypothetical protein